MSSEVNGRLIGGIKSITRLAWMHLQATQLPEPVQWCSKADLAVPIFQMGHLEAQRGRGSIGNKQRNWSPKEKKNES